jgi:hypothetical protein
MHELASQIYLDDSPESLDIIIVKTRELTNFCLGKVGHFVTWGFFKDAIKHIMVPCFDEKGVAAGQGQGGRRVGAAARRLEQVSHTDAKVGGGEEEGE